MEPRSWRRWPILVAALAVGVAGCATARATGSPPGSHTPTSSEPTEGPTPVPTQDGPADPTSIEAVEYSPPEPRCPGPPVGLEPPGLMAFAGDADVLVTMGSSTLRTCSTARSDELVPPEPAIPLIVSAGGALRFELPVGWRFLHWEGWDRPAIGEGANVLLGGETPDRPTSIEVPAPSRAGDSILGVEGWVISEDERTIASINGAVRVRQP